MITRIILESKKKEEVYGLAEKIHNLLAGNQEYIDSNIVLNFDNSIDPQEVTVFFDVDVCLDKEDALKKAGQVVDLFKDETWPKKGI